jgi:hypothetical protein
LLPYFLLFTTICGLSQNQDILIEVAETIEKDSGRQFTESINSFANSIVAKRKKNELKFLKEVFYQTHRTFLKKYEAYSSLDQLIEVGKYDCLTATILYSAILEKLGFDFRIIETNYHIFIIANLDNKEILLETTDGTKGFVTNPAEVERLITLYKYNRPTNNKSAKSLEFNFTLFRQVKAKEIVGLIYFNQAVKAFNNHNWKSCLTLLTKSKKKYNSARVKEITELALGMVKLENEAGLNITSRLNIKN